MIIAMPTVPHSGTHFLRLRVLKGREQVNGQDRFRMLNPTDKIEEGRDIIFTAHYDPKYLARWADIVNEYPTVIVMRHPARTTESYKRRGVIGGNGGVPQHGQWDKLLYMSEFFNDVMFLHLDSPVIRIIQARAIQKRFEIPMGVDWTVGQEVNTKAGTHEWEPPDDYDVPQEHINFYQEMKTCQ